MTVRTLDHCYVISGGPGSGKSTLLAELAAMGYTCLPEGARSIIAAHASIGSDVRQDLRLFGELTLSWDMRSWAEAAAMAGPVFSDRGLGELVTFFESQVGDVPAHVWRAAREWRYNSTVFVAPFWAEIYRQDEERVQSAEFAASVYAPTVEIYRRLDYDVVELPRVSPRERAEFVLTHL
ncbi:MAG: AAA family ATPase [Propionibacteriaceae bacterium]